MSRLTSFYILIGIIVLIAVLFFKVMASFLLPLFLAAVLVVIFKPVHNRLTTRLKGRTRVAAGLTTGIIAMLVIAPIALAVMFAAAEATSLVRDFRFEDINPVLKRVRSKLGFEEPHIAAMRSLEIAINEHPFDTFPSAKPMPGESDWFTDITSLTQALRDTCPTDTDTDAWMGYEAARVALAGIDFSEEKEIAARINQLQKSTEQLKYEVLGGRYRAVAITFLYPSESEIRGMIDRVLESGLEGKLLAIGASTLSVAVQLLFGLAIMLIAVYFFLVDGPGMIDNMMRLSPLADDYELELVIEFGNVSRAVVLATLLSAVAQGLMAGLGYWFAGLESTFLLTLLTILFAMVPFVGAAAIWLPASLYLMLATDNVWAGIFLAAYGAIPVSLADNIIKPMVLKKQSRLHPLFALLSVLGGVQALGPIGILVGPMAVAFLQTLLNMLRREMGAIAREDEDKETVAGAETGG
jgi:predicted PurR-regulated permease PerM